MGIRGRFLLIAAGTIGAGFLSFLVSGFFTDNKLISFAIMIIIVGSGYGLIRIKQKQGLHNKKIDKGVFIYKKLFKSPLD